MIRDGTRTIQNPTNPNGLAMRVTVRPTLELPVFGHHGAAMGPLRAAVLAGTQPAIRVLAVVVPLAVVVMGVAGVLLIALQMVQWWAEVPFAATLPRGGWPLNGGIHHVP